MDALEDCSEDTEAGDQAVSTGTNQTLQLMLDETRKERDELQRELDKMKRLIYTIHDSSWKDRLENDEYINWIKCTLALVETKDALGPVVEEAFQSLQENILTKVGISSPSDHDHTTFDDVTYRKTRQCWRIQTGCTDCEAAFDFLISYFTDPSSEKIAWENSKGEALLSSHWTIAKTFMSKLRRPAAASRDIDPAAMIRLLQNCKRFVVNPAGLLNKVSDIRNELMHSCDNKVSGADVELHLLRLIDLLEGGEWRDREECKGMVQKLHQLMDNDMQVRLQDNELAALEVQNECMTADIDETEESGDDPTELLAIKHISDQRIKEVSYEQEIQTLSDNIREKDVRNKEVEEEMEQLTREKAELSERYDSLSDKFDDVLEERNIISSQKEDISRDLTELLEGKQNIQDEYARLAQNFNELQNEQKRILLEKDRVLHEKSILEDAKDAVVRERDDLLRERSAVGQKLHDAGCGKVLNTSQGISGVSGDVNGQDRDSNILQTLIEERAILAEKLDIAVEENKQMQRERDALRNEKGGRQQGTNLAAELNPLEDGDALHKMLRISRDPKYCPGQNILLIGCCQSGKSLIINTIIKALGGVYYPRAGPRTRNMQHFPHCGLLIDDITDGPLMHVTRELQTKLPNIIDTPGIGDEDAMETTEILELLIGGNIPPATNFATLLDLQRKHGTGSLRHCYNSRKVEWSAHHVVFVHNVEQEVPLRLIACLRKILDDGKHQATLHVILTHFDQVDHPGYKTQPTTADRPISNDVYTETKRLVMEEIGLNSQHDDKVLTWSSYCDHVGYNSVSVDDDALEFLTRIMKCSLRQKSTSLLGGMFGYLFGGKSK